MRLIEVRIKVFLKGLVLYLGITDCSEEAAVCEENCFCL